jgi:hypothetical protein
MNMDKGASKLASCKACAAIVTQMFVSLQARPDADMDIEFFMHENACNPPSLANNGKLRTKLRSYKVLNL